MKIRISALAAALLTVATACSARANTTYSFTGTTFDTATGTLTHTINGFTYNDYIHGQLTLKNPLPLDKIDYDPIFLDTSNLVDYSFFIGEVNLKSTTQSFTHFMPSLLFSTDSSGNIIDWFVLLNQKGILTTNSSERDNITLFSTGVSAGILDDGVTISKGTVTQPGGSWTTIINTSPAAGPPGGAPEPASWALMMLGVGGMGAALRTRKRHLKA